MQNFDNILNWKLKAGSHQFPGKAGGTCINEAAIVAAGFEYQPVSSVHAMPPCFSRPICSLAMSLNDQASETERQFLLPYVARLACADTPEIEGQRETYIAARTGMWVPFEEGLKVLEGALAIGRQADPLGPDLVWSRMRSVQQSPMAREDARFMRWFAQLVPQE